MDEELRNLLRSTIQPFKWALIVRPPMERWTQGRVALLGDAAHPTLPFVGQGACMAMEDGYILARAISVADDVQQALQRYEFARKDRTRRIVTSSSDNTKRFHNPAVLDSATASEYVKCEFSAEKVRERYDWIYGYDVNAVPV